MQVTLYNIVITDKRNKEKYTWLMTILWCIYCKYFLLLATVALLYVVLKIIVFYYQKYSWKREHGIQRPVPKFGTGKARHGCPTGSYCNRLFPLLITMCAYVRTVIPVSSANRNVLKFSVEAAVWNVRPHDFEENLSVFSRAEHSAGWKVHFAVLTVNLMIIHASFS